MDIQHLLKQMTLKEKLGQMTQLPPHMFIEASKTQVYGEKRTLKLDPNDYMLAGSVLGIRNAQEMIEIQSLILKHSRLKIPALIMADVIHGYETIFPIPLAQAASFNPPLTTKMNQISAIEASTSGIHVTFAPMVDLSRDARWGRVMEGYGEDPLLNQAFAAAAVKGYQHSSPKDHDYVASCFKHFAGYGASEAGRDYNTVDMSYERFYNLYQPSYQAAIDAGASMAMLAFNTFNGIPATIHQRLVKNILKEHMGFGGVVISDYDALYQTVAHGAAFDDYDAAKLGILAGLDIEMGSSAYLTHGEALVQDGLISESEIDQAVLKILALKDALGLFEDPFKGANIDKEKEIVRSETHLNQAHLLSIESPVLLKNNGVLPLTKKEKIALIGPFAQTKDLLGAWRWHGHPDHSKTYDEALENQHVTYLHLETDLKDIDTIILTVGEHVHETGESTSKVNIDIDPVYKNYIQDMQSKGIRVIVLVQTGRPLNIESINDADAIIYTWFLGSKHAEVINDILNGRINPSGKLPMQLPRHVGQYPFSYHDFNTGRPYHPIRNEYTTKYLDVDLHPLYPFGYGLSYTPMTFKIITDSIDTWDGHAPLEIDILIDNPNDRIGKEVIQCYMNITPSIPVRPVKKLIQFVKTTLNPYERQIIRFTIKKEDLYLYDESHTRHNDPGTLTLMFGLNAKDTTSYTLNWRPL